MRKFKNGKHAILKEVEDQMPPWLGTAHKESNVSPSINIVKPRITTEQVVITVEDSVFTGPELVPRFEMKSDNVQEYMVSRLSDSQMRLGRNITKLKNLYLVLLTFMMDEPTEQEMIDSLSTIEKQLLIVFLRKKRVKNSKRATATVEFMECARKCPMKKGKAE